MKRILTIACLLVSSYGLMAQKHYLELGLGTGTTPLSEDRVGKLSLNVAAMKPISDQLHLGLDLSLGGNFVPGDYSTLQGNTEILDPHGSHWSSIMFMGRYYPIAKVPFYTGLGVGINSYWSYVHTIEDDRIHRINLAVNPEIGFTINQKLNMGLRYFMGGSTRDFEGSKLPDYGGNTVQLNSEPVNILMLTFGWRIGL